ncbi:hypothetical protein CEE44_05095 [Candidatus Woesearchaeota archaeon B3_Woes]|nr:MAG: hypothetical protein CEE44_05095 [Candidatus Woesearchaeota archaeon B3_Woes]
MADDYFTDILNFDKKAYFDKYKEEIMEKSMNQYVYTGYPAVKTPEHRRRSVYETYTKPIEETYFWILEHMTTGREGFPLIEKITDVFTAAEQSAFWGQSSTRLGVQQDKVSQYLATIGKMVKDMFQLVRELRILDERIGYYEDSNDRSSKSRESAEITLKGIYVDMAEGGSKNPSSVFGMARELQFTSLPDLFFSVHPPTSREVDEYVNKLEFNEAVKRVLKRKLRSFMQWKEHTSKEIKTRKKFTLKYMRQHYDVIHMYLSWIRPYLRNIARILSESMENKKITSADLVSAFEGSLIEVEYIVRRMPKKNKDYFACVLATFIMRTRPDMSYHQEGYRHQGPLHTGKIEVITRRYAWTEEDFQNYKKLRAAEDFEIIGRIDRSVKEAMEGLGNELQKYLEEAGEETMLMEKRKKEPKKQKKKWVNNLVGTFITIKPKQEKPKKKTKKDLVRIEKEKKAADKAGAFCQWLTYKNYKKSHGFLSW